MTSSARTSADRAALPDISSSERSILRRRDVALAPLILISIGSFALALSQGLRPSGQTDVSWANYIVIPGALIFGTMTGLFALAQERAWGRLFRGALWFYALFAVILLVGLTTVSLLDGGLESVAYSAVMLVAPYVGFVFPRVWSRWAVGGLLVLTGIVQFLRPDANPLDAATLFVLVFVGWLTGLLVRSGHEGAAREALLLSRSDSLTRALNRRGFLEQFGSDLAIANRAGRPTALLVVDLNGFKLINDTQGHAAGDALLAWVGSTIPSVLPAGAAFGRLGGDEFAVAVPGVGRSQAEEIGDAVRVSLSERVGASIGVSSRLASDADVESLMQAADAALYVAKSEPTSRVQYREAAPGAPLGSPHRRVRRPALTYAELAAAGGPPATFNEAVFDGRWFYRGFGMIAAAGTPIVIATFLTGGHSFFEEVLRILGVPWILANLGLGIGYRNRGRFVDPPVFPWVLSSILVGGGVGAAALANGAGAPATIMGAFYLKILFDWSLARRQIAVWNFAMMLFFWGVVLVFGPRDVLWVAPYQLLLLVGSGVLGAIGRQAFLAAKGARIQIASTDALTSLLNRRGFEQVAAEVHARAVARDLTLAVVTFDLDDFKGINDTRGHAAGDQLLRAVAHLTRDTLIDPYAIGRLGGDEFVAIIPAPDAQVVAEQVRELDLGLSALVGGSIGSAIYGPDGLDLDVLMRVADHRAYAIKQARTDRHHRAQADAAAGPGAIATASPEPKPDAIA